MSGIEGNSLRLGAKNGEAYNLENLKEGIRKNEANKTIFEKFDTNGNGILDKDEIENLKQNIMQYGDDGVISNREAKKILKNQGLENSQKNELFEFLKNIQASSDDIERSFYSLYDNGVKAVNVVYKKDENGFVKTSSFNRETGAVIQENFNNGVQDRTVHYDSEGNVTGEVIKQGAKTTEKDAGGRVLKETIEKGNGLKETVQYEYDGNGTTPSKITKTAADGSVVVTDGNGNPINPPTAEEHTEVDDGRTVFENGRVLVKTETGATIQEPGKEPVEIKYDADGNILSGAKEGETFDMTAKRLGIEKGTPEYEKFKELNEKASKNGWFVVGAEVKVPAGMEDKVNLEGLNVDSKTEVKKYEEKYPAPPVEEAQDVGDTDTNVTTPYQRYNSENLEKTYPKDKYEITNPYGFDSHISVIDKTTGKPVLEIVLEENSASITKYNEDGKEIEFTQENAQGTVLYRTYKNPETGEFESAEYYDNNGEITETRKFYKSESGSSEAEVTEYSGGEAVRIYYTESGKEERYPIAEALRDDIYAKTSFGLPTTGKDIGKHIEKINSSNVRHILEAYQKINKDEESLVTAILGEVGLPKEERMQYLAHIKEALLQNAAENGKYAEDISAEFDREVRYQMRKIGFADAEYLDSYINKLNSRHNTTLDNVSKPNGKIDEEFSQGQTGDCWLVASIKAIAQTPKGLEILNDSLSVDDKGNVTVTLKGAGKSYVITPEELKGNNQLTSGDADVRAIEIAMDKYFQEERGVRERLDLNGNLPQVAFKLLTGKGGRNEFSDTFGRIPDFWFNDSQIDNFNKENHVAVVFTSKKEDMSFDSHTGDETVTLISNHAYTVKGSDEENVYLINPWDTSAVITVPRDKFKEFFDAIDEFDL